MPFVFVLGGQLMHGVTFSIRQPLNNRLKIQEHRRLGGRCFRRQVCLNSRQEETARVVT